MVGEYSHDSQTETQEVRGDLCEVIKRLRDKENTAGNKQKLYRGVKIESQRRHSSIFLCERVCTFAQS